MFMFCSDFLKKISRQNLNSLKQPTFLGWLFFLGK